MDGPLNNYTQIKEVKELPRLEYTSKVYISGSLTDIMMNQAGIPENPVDGNTFVQAFLGEPDVYIVIVKYYNDLPEKGEDNAYYVVVNEQKLYSWDSFDNKYTDDTEIIKQIGMVYVGTDKSVIGTMDITQDDPKGTIGFYLIVSEPKDVSTSTIYKKEIMTEAGVVNTNYVFGEKFDIVTVENQEAFQTKFTEILKSKGFNDELITNLLILLTGYTLLSANLDFTDDSNSRMLSINMYDNGKYIYKNNQISQILQQNEPIEDEFNTIDKLYNFINNLLIEASDKNEELKQMIDSMTANNLEYKYTNEPLNDSNLFLNVVEGPIEPKGTGVYQYYIYNGKEYIELGGKGGATENIVKEINLTTLSINDAIQAMKNITFTKEEAIKLSTTSNLIILANLNYDGGKAQVVNYFYNKEVMSATTGVIIVFKDLYWLLLNQCELIISIRQDDQNKDVYNLSAVISSSVTIGKGSIGTTEWSQDTTYSAYGYKYKAKFIPEGLDGNLYINDGQVNVIFGMEDAVSGNFAPYVTLEKGSFTIYAKEKPTKLVSFDYEVISR